MAGCYFGCRSTLSYLLPRNALGQGISFVVIASSLGGRCTTNTPRKAILIVSTALLGFRRLRFGQLLVLQSILPPLYVFKVDNLQEQLGHSV